MRTRTDALPDAAPHRRDRDVRSGRPPRRSTKEQIAGFDLLECADRDAAIAVAARHPTARIGTFELRSLVRP
jgi:hypothetical protein